MTEVPQKAYAFRRAREHDFKFYMFHLNTAWNKAEFKDLKEYARSLMHLADECESAWEDGEPAWAVKERE
jgi:hypothetical protein